MTYLERGGIRIYYELRRRNEGIPLLLTHRFPASSQMRALIVAALAPRPPGSGPPMGLPRAARGMRTRPAVRVIASLPSIDFPVLVIVGADDRPCLGSAEYVAAKIPAAELVVIPDAGHTCNLGQPELFN